MMEGFLHQNKYSFPYQIKREGEILKRNEVRQQLQQDEDDADMKHGAEGNER